MKKMLIALSMVSVVMTACAQTNKPQTTSSDKPTVESYEQQLGKLASDYESLYADYKALAKKESLTDAEKQQLAEIEAKAEQMDSLQSALVKQLISDYRDTKAPAKYVSAIMYDLSYDELKAVCDPSTGYYNEPEMEAPKRLLAGLELRRPGSDYHELEMSDLEGKAVKLSDWVGKGNYVLVDFWASWCGPCRMEMPNVVEAYKKYHAKGFDVVGVSFDNNKEKWAAAVKSLGMDWHQMSDLKGWGCAASEVYGVKSIPSNVLVDPQGKIVASDLRAEKLQQTLAEIYSEANKHAMKCKIKVKEIGSLKNHRNY